MSNLFSQKIINPGIPTKNIFYSEISIQSDIEGSSTNVGKLRTYSISMFPDMGGVKIKNLSANDILIHGEFIPSK